jgi:hypothetical protein
LLFGCGRPTAPEQTVTSDTNRPGSGSTAAMTAAEGGTEDERVLEAVFRHELRDTADSEAICLRVRDVDNAIGDASDALIAALRRTYPKARKASECEGGGPERTVSVKATGAAAVMLDIGPVRWEGSIARVGGGGVSRGGSMHIREVEYSLTREAGAWVVKGERVTMQN